jgi:hypothetical protein
MRVKILLTSGQDVVINAPEHKQIDFIKEVMSEDKLSPWLEFYDDDKKRVAAIDFRHVIGFIAMDSQELAARPPIISVKLPLAEYAKALEDKEWAGERMQDLIRGAFMQTVPKYEENKRAILEAYEHIHKSAPKSEFNKIKTKEV